MPVGTLLVELIMWLKPRSEAVAARFLPPTPVRCCWIKTATTWRRR
ncbi:hypothetical protein ACVXHA_00700 [Escherichia coli]